MDIRGGQLSPQSPVAPPAPTAALQRARAALRPSERAPIPPSSIPPSNPDYEGGLCESLNTFISLEPLGAEQANNPHMKA